MEHSRKGNGHPYLAPIIDFMKKFVNFFVEIWYNVLYRKYF